MPSFRDLWQELNKFAPHGQLRSWVGFAFAGVWQGYQDMYSTACYQQTIFQLKACRKASKTQSSRVYSCWQNIDAEAVTDAFEHVA